MTFVPIGDIRSSARQRLPPWFQVRFVVGRQYQEMRRLTQQFQLHTICEEAHCPNIWECWNQRTATFLILGEICTRRCHYCAVTTGRPKPLDPNEPQRVAQAARALGLRHVVVTSVNRDDVPDGGATIFAETIIAVRAAQLGCTIEVLIPDVGGDADALATVLHAAPDVVNHNIETVPRLFSRARPQGKYARSLAILEHATRLGARTKSGLMAGLGETMDEIRGVMRDLRSVGCGVLTIGQDLQPTRRRLSVSRL